MCACWRGTVEAHTQRPPRQPGRQPGRKRHTPLMASQGLSLGILAYHGLADQAGWLAYSLRLALRLSDFVKSPRKMSTWHLHLQSAQAKPKLTQITASGFIAPPHPVLHKLASRAFRRKMQTPTWPSSTLPFNRVSPRQRVAASSLATIMDQGSTAVVVSLL